MSELQTKINTAIERLKAFEPADEPYYLCYSGGKDSDCIRILADLAGVKHDIVHNLTTVDAPETVRYIKSIPNVQVVTPQYSMWQLIEKNKMPPTRLARYCCSELKEKGGKGMKADFIRYPKYRDNYLRAFRRMLKAREAAGLDNNSWNTPEAVMMWWVGDNPLQMSFETPEYLK